MSTKTRLQQGICLAFVSWLRHISLKKNGAGLKQLTFSPGYDAEATAAFDGSKILYTFIKSGDLDIWSMNIDGTDKTQ